MKQDLEVQNSEKSQFEYFSHLNTKNVTFIEHLNFTAKNFEGKKEALKLCQEISQCSNLLNLSITLSISQSIGLDMMQQMGQKIAKCKNLTSFYLKINREPNAKREFVSELISEISKCNDLQSIVIHQQKNNISEIEAHCLGKEFTKIKNLKHASLIFSESQLSSEGAISLVVGISNCPQLTSLYLDFSRNKIKKELAGSLGTQLKKLKYLDTLYLNLTSNSIGVPGVHQLCKELSLCENIVNLSLIFKQNYFGMTGGEKVGDQLKKWTQLQNLTLDLNMNEMKCRGAIRIGTSLGFCTNLTSLKLGLSHNVIQKEGIEAIGYGISKCVNLVSLAINLHNNLLGNGVESLVSSISKCFQIQSLHLNFSYCRINEQGVSFIGQEIAKLSNLQYLILHFRNNELKVNSLTNICQAIIIHQNLVEFNLQFGFCFSIPEIQIQQILVDISSLSKLRLLTLDISDTYQHYNKKIGDRFQRKITSKLKKLIKKHIIII